MVRILRTLGGRSLLLVGLVLGLAIPTGAEEPRKKLIHLGWESPTPTWLAEHLAEVEASAPWDGVTVRLNRPSPEGFALNDITIMGPAVWRRAWLEPDLAALRSLRSTRLTDNFVRVNLDPGTAVAWDDDDRWRVITTNLATIAWFARQGGLKGVLLDPECYESEQFSGSTVDGDPAKAARLARQRGRECMAAMGAELPQGRFLVLWLYSLGRTAYARGAPAGHPANDGLRLDPYGLWPAFCDGLLEGLPSEARLIDGCEDGYWPQDPGRFATLYGELRQPRSRLNRMTLDPALVDKFRRQVDIGFGLWIDLFMNPQDKRHTVVAAAGELTVARFARQVEAALAASDEYVWIYSEQARWFDSPYYLDFFAGAAAKRPGGGKLVRDTWPTADQALRWAVDPDSEARLALDRRRDREGNLVRNPRFEVPPLDLVGSGPVTAAGPATPVPTAPGWLLYAPGGLGSATPVAVVEVAADRVVERSSLNHALRCTGFTGETVAQPIPVQAGKRYVVEGYCRRQGNADAVLAVAWGDAGGRLVQTLECASVAFLPDETGRSANGWQRAVAVVEAPVPAERLLLLLAVGHERAAEDVVWFDDLGVWPLEAVRDGR